MRIFGTVLIVLAGLVMPSIGLAQQASESFGKSRIQYKSFEWRYFSAGTFDLYFYKGGNELAEQAVKYLQEEYERVTDVLGYVPLSKTKIFLYNSYSDLLQSNIGVNESFQAVAGETVFVKNVVEIAYPGTLEAFKTELVYQVASKLLQEMMFGGSLTDMFQNAYLLNLPDWYIPGAARYIAYGWGPRMDDYVRDLVANQRVRKLDRYQGDEAVLLGQSIWNYIAEKYGRSNISSVLNLTRIIRNEERSIANTLGTTFDRFKAGWVSYYKGQAEKVAEEYVYPDDQYLITTKNRRGVYRNRVSLSPNGRYLAYSENDKGRFSIIIYDKVSDSEKTVIQGGYRLLNQQVNQDLPIMTWQDSVTLAVVAERNGSPALWLYEVGEKEKTVVPLSTFHAIQHISFNDNGRLMVMSAEEDGRSDIYLVSLRKNVWRKITDDAYDDEFPEFVPGTNAIVFTSNRSSDTLRSTTLEEVKDDLLTFNLFVYNLDSTKNVLARITNTLSTDIFPLASDTKTFYYLSDQKGIRNIFRYNTADSIYSQISNFANSIKAISINFETSEVAYVAEMEGKDYVYLQPIDFSKTRFTLPTARQQRQQAKYLANRMLVNRARMAAEMAKVDTVENSGDIDEASILDPNDYQFGTPKEGVEVDPNAPIDTENYAFNVQEDSQDERSSFLQNYRRTVEEATVTGPFDYRTRFSADNLTTSLEIDPIIGWGFTASTQMNDVLENHRFRAGTFVRPDLTGGKVYLEYDYLPMKVDVGIRVSRKSFDRRFDNRPFQRYSLNKLEVKAALPHSVSMRTEGSLFYALTQFQELNPAYLLAPPSVPLHENQSFLGIRGAFILDNSVINGMNQMEGTRAKVLIQNHFALGDASRSFGNISADVRHYQLLHRNLVLAVRGFYGRFFGPQRQSYLLGGMDNWAFNATDNLDQPGNPLSIDGLVNNRQILFVEYVTSLRGFNYNALNGVNALLGNVELRLPLVRYFYSGPITSNFFRNLQLTGFYDIGSSWTGPSPWNPNNELNTRVIADEGSAFRVELNNYNNPWLMSYGVGFRSVILGYYTKVDLAWPIVNYRTQEPRLLLTLGYDF